DSNNIKNIAIATTTNMNDNNIKNTTTTNMNTTTTSTTKTTTTNNNNNTTTVTKTDNINISYNALTKNLSQLSSNKYCIDCSTINPQWVCISHGIFICLECASNHRSFGVQISKVRSINMDTFDIKSYTTLELGGNENIKKYLKDNNMENVPVREKYRMNELKIYREALLKEVNKKLGIIEEKRNIVSVGSKKRSNGYNKNRINYDNNKDNTMDKITSIIKENAILIKDKSIYYSEVLHETVIKPVGQVIVEKSRSIINRIKNNDVEDRNTVRECIQGYNNSYTDNNSYNSNITNNTNSYSNNNNNSYNDGNINKKKDDNWDNWE
ncbi:ADP-ribosylation factor GTPase activating protein, partial [Spraguea lophii 42_110]